MNQLYLLNLKRVLATRYKNKSSLLLFACECVCKTRIRISVISFMRAAIKYAISFFMYYILYFVCILCLFFSFCVYFLNLQKNNNVCVCHCVVLFYFFFFFVCSLCVLYSSSHTHMFFFFIFFLCYFCSGKILIMIN
jgi:hypothetical protein